MTAGVSLAHFDDREIGDQGALNPGTTASLERARTFSGQIELLSDPRRPVVGWISGTGQLFAGGYALQAELTVTAHPLPQLVLEIDPQFTYTQGEPRFATTEGDRPNRQYVIGSLLAKSAGAVVRASYTFTPRLTLQAYAQLFLASGHYSDLRTLPGAGGPIRLTDIAAAPASALAPNAADFAQAAVNANVVLRWEYRLGALVYLVYARSQIPTVDNLNGTPGDLRWSALRHGGTANVILLKVSYWWSS
jgi:hypothetical protein